MTSRSRSSATAGPCGTEAKPRTAARRAQGSENEGGKRAQAHRLAAAAAHLAAWCWARSSSAVLLVGGLFFLGYSLVNIPPANAAAIAAEQRLPLRRRQPSSPATARSTARTSTLAQISKDRPARRARRRGPRLLQRVRHRPQGDAPRRLEHRHRQGQAVRLHHHPAVREELLPGPGTDRHAARSRSSSSRSSSTARSPRTRSSRATSTPATSAATPTASRPPPRPTTASTPRTSTTAQGAYLAALLNAPSEYDVVAHPENKAAAQARWNYVLDGMVKKDWLEPSRARRP